MRRTKEEAANTRANIVEAALRCFDRHGIASSTLEQIACEAGVTKGAVYHHFRGKRDILGAIRDQVSLPLLDEADTTLLRRSELPALERIERFLTHALDDLEVDRRKRCALSVMLFKCEYVGELQEELSSWRSKNERLTRALESAYRQARESGELADSVKPRVAAVETLMFLTGLVRLWLLHESGGAMRRNARAAIRSHVRGRAAR
jgi:TetR/AcrR family transcriptional regulator, acrAB operon repressor